MTLLLEDIHSSFIPYFEKCSPILEQISKIIEVAPYNPSKENIFRFATNPISRIKVVVLGQDPYPALGAATGRSFEVAGLCSWHKPFRQVSLKNILRNIYCSYIDQDPYSTPFYKVLSEMDKGNIEIPPPNEFFRATEDSGVLWLNSYLTCPVGNSGGHRHLWRNFTEGLLSFLSSQNPKLIFFLWGTDAQSFEPYLKGVCYKSRHPMMCSEKYPDDFLKNPCFYETKDLIPWASLPAQNAIRKE